jgi:integrase
MQTGSVGRHGDGWRGRWREGGKHRSTDIVRTKGEARRLLNAELLRLEMGDRYRAPITLAELADRFMAQYDRAPKTVKCARGRLVRPLAAFGDAQAADITTEALQRFVAALPAKRVGKAYKRDIVRTLRAVYSFGVDAGLVDRNPAVKVKAPRPVRGERILPLTIAEVDAVAEECGRWGPLVTFMADTGARPAEAVAVEWRHVDLDRATVELPGQKTELAWRTVHMTERGVSAIQAMPRGLKTRRVFNIAGRPISWVYFWREVWTPALKTAGLEHRAPYNLRHTYAWHSLQAGVPIQALARQMGHTDVSRTFTVYGGWSREMGADTAALRQTWAAGDHAVTKPAATPLPEPE